ncbi:hypothetical protein KAR28_05605 [Candidatus Parcubacteria bacterium]|nr:hypothetical protein [Candidatus Parcubacteria bacterium]
MTIDWSSVIQASSTVVLVIITAYYAWQTRETVKLMKKSEESRNRPRIVIYIEQRKEWVNMVDLIVKNYSNDVAREVKFELNRDMDLFNNKDKLSEISFIKNGIKNLVPQQEIRIPFVSLVDRVKELNNIELIISIDYRSISSVKYKENYIVDFKSLKERQIGEPAEYKASEALKNISITLNKIEADLKNKL